DVKDEVHIEDVENVFGELTQLCDAQDVPLLVITGGEPMLQQKAIAYALQHVGAPTQHVEIETNGTVAPNIQLLSDSRVYFNVSPKLEHSGNSEAKRYRRRALKAFAACPRAAFKFVVEQRSDFDEIERIAHELNN